MKKALILTVGTGTGPETDITRPLIKAIKRSGHPDRVGFVVSRTSKTYADSIIEQLHLEPESYDILILSDEDDIVKIYEETELFLESLGKRGFSPDNIEIDFTSGTKAMSAGLALSGVSCRCASLNYITGKREKGRVINGTERFLSVSADQIFAHENLRLSAYMIENLRFDASLQILAEISPNILPERLRILHSNLVSISNAYREWDLFNHGGFAEHYFKLSQFDDATQMFQISDSVKKKISELVKKAETVEFCQCLLADLFCNAWRRHWEGKYDDAVARTYRLIEFLAQMILKRDHGIKTNNVALPKVPEELRKRFEQLKDPRDEKVKIGLRNAYELLQTYGNSLGDAFFKSPLQTLLQRRNRSILAHGTTPVSKETSDNLLTETAKLISATADNFRDLCHEINFPWLKNSMPQELFS